MHISATKWCIVGYLSNALWDLWDLSTGPYPSRVCQWGIYTANRPANGLVNIHITPWPPPGDYHHPQKNNHGDASDSFVAINTYSTSAVKSPSAGTDGRSSQTLCDIQELIELFVAGTVVVFGGRGQVSFRESFPRTAMHVLRNLGTNQSSVPIIVNTSEKTDYVVRSCVSGHTELIGADITNGNTVLRNIFFWKKKDTLLIRLSVKFVPRV